MLLSGNLRIIFIRYRHGLFWFSLQSSKKLIRTFVLPKENRVFQSKAESTTLHQKARLHCTLTDQNVQLSSFL